MGDPPEGAGVSRYRLPQRWQQVLWYTEIERRPLAQVGSLLGLTPNEVAALAHRARAGLRRAYLAEHVREPASPAGHGG